MKEVDLLSTLRRFSAALRSDPCKAADVLDGFVKWAESEEQKKADAAARAREADARTAALAELGKASAAPDVVTGTES